MRFGYACPDEHELIENFPVGKAPATVVCHEHAHTAKRVFDVPQFTEDRIRFFRRRDSNAPSDRWSWAIGQDMPDSRQERRRIEKERGIEFVSQAEARKSPDVEKSLSYVNHLRSGGKPIPPGVLDPTAKIQRGTLAKKLSEKGVRLGADSGGFRLSTPEESERQMRDYAPEWNDKEATTPKK
jgi:hypothetical protein